VYEALRHTTRVLRDLSSSMCCVLRGDRGVSEVDTTARALKTLSLEPLRLSLYVLRGDRGVSEVNIPARRISVSGMPILLSS
jgi:hypothetical protein